MARKGLIQIKSVIPGSTHGTTCEIHPAQILSRFHTVIKEAINAHYLYDLDTSSIIAEYLCSTPILQFSTCIKTRKTSFDHKYVTSKSYTVQGKCYKEIYDPMATSIRSITWGYLDESYRPLESKVEGSHHAPGVVKIPKFEIFHYVPPDKHTRLNVEIEHKDIPVYILAKYNREGQWCGEQNNLDSDEEDYSWGEVTEAEKERLRSL
jgi:hypothetical protein